MNNWINSFIISSIFGILLSCSPIRISTSWVNGREWSNPNLFKILKISIEGLLRNNFNLSGRCKIRNSFATEWINSASDNKISNCSLEISLIAKCKMWDWSNKKSLSKFWMPSSFSEYLRSLWIFDHSFDSIIGVLSPSKRYKSRQDSAICSLK